jgi:RNA polymerase primary sigma factor
VEEVISPFFGDVVFSYTYPEALRDDVVAPFELGLAGVKLSATENYAYEAYTKKLNDSMSELQNKFNYPSHWDEFFAIVSSNVENGSYFGRETELCQQYLTAWSGRRQLLANAEGKLKLLATLSAQSDSWKQTLIFTEVVEMAEKIRAVLQSQTSVELISGEVKAQERKQILRGFTRERVRVILAPRVLDEGLNVPGAENAIIVSASKTKRQMVQRMGRVVRKKDDGRSAKILIIYVLGTPEDIENGGHEAFLDEVAPVASKIRQFHAGDEPEIGNWLSSVV